MILAQNLPHPYKMMTLLPPMNVLILDYDGRHLQPLGNLLTDDYRVYFAETREQALLTLNDETIDIFVLDGDGQGLDVLKQLRANVEWENIAVVVVSHQTDDETIADALTLGANDYIGYPVQPQTFKARIHAQRLIKQRSDYQTKTIRDLQEYQRLQTRLMKIAWHDLRHPLTNIRMAEHILADYLNNNAENPDGSQILSSVIASFDNMQEIFHEVLGIFEVGEQSVQLTAVDVQRVVDVVCLQYEPSATYKQIILQQGAVDYQVYADALRLEHAISNLVSNAIKYSPLENTIIIEAVHNNEGMVQILVRDNGVGVPVEERHLLFTEGKLSSQPTAGEHSAGLGLWIVKHLVESMGGKVGADFPPDEGTIFWIALPSAPVEQRL
jgi:two-component system sensor histidine kinase/response regulator